MEELRLLRYSRLLMLVCGNWQRPYFQSPIIQQSYRFYSFVIKLFYYSVCFLMLVEFFYLLQEGDVNKLTDNMRITITCSLPAMKSLIFQNDRFLNLIARINKEEQLIFNNPKREEEYAKALYEKRVRYVDTFFVTVVGMSGGTTIFRFIAPIIMDMYRPEGSERFMIILIRFPFDQNRHYGAAITIQSVALFLAFLYYDMSLIFYISVLSFVKIQLKILQYRFEHFHEYRLQFPSEDDVALMKRLSAFHQSIIRFVGDLNGALKMTLLVEFLLSSLNIACVAFHVISAENKTEINFSFAYMVVMVGQLLILAWHADEICAESIRVSDVVFAFSWHETPIEAKKIVSMIILRAHEPLKLTVGPFRPLTNRSIISVINAAYSYVTIMTKGF